MGISRWDGCENGLLHRNIHAAWRDPSVTFEHLAWPSTPSLPIAEGKKFKGASQGSGQNFRMFDEGGFVTFRNASAAGHARKDMSLLTATDLQNAAPFAAISAVHPPC
ncbi:MAG: hypothetical protein QM742_19390 [Aquabacterium sp.]